MDKIILGLDIGYSNLKMALGGPDQDLPQVQVFPAGAALTDKLGQSFMGNGQDGVEVLVDGAPYTACIEPLRANGWGRALHADYPTTPNYRALFHAAILQAGTPEIAKLVTGLPMSQYLDKPRVKALKDLMAGEHQITKARKVKVHEVEVIGQPMGSYVEAVMTLDEGLREARVLIFDTGFFSLDWTVIDNQEILRQFSGSSTYATSKILEEAAKLIRADHGATLEVAKIEAALRTGKKQVMVFGEKVDLMPYIDQASKNLENYVANEIRSNLRTQAGDVDVVVLAGGGSIYYEAAAKAAFPKSRVLIPHNPVTANASGYWHFGLLEGGNA